MTAIEKADRALGLFWVGLALVCLVKLWGTVMGIVFPITCLYMAVLTVGNAGMRSLVTAILGASMVAFGAFGLWLEVAPRGVMFVIFLAGVAIVATKAAKFVQGMLVSMLPR